MRPNIFLLLFFVAVFIFEATASNCLSSLAPSSKKFVKPRNNGPYSRFLDNGKYVIIARDHVSFWLKIPNPHTTELTINFRVMDTYIGKYTLYIQLFGPDDGCLLQEEAKAGPGQSGSISIDYDCGCELYENGKGESYLLMELWTDRIIYHDMSFEQDGDQLEMYLDEKEAKKWNKMPTCPNIWINKKVMETKINGEEMNGMKFIRELWRQRFHGKKLFYQKNGNDYINLDSPDMVLFLERKDVLEKVYVMLELQEGQILNETIQIKIEVDGAAPDKYYELINGGKGLKITFKHTECLQVYYYIGLVRYVIKTSIPGMLRVSFYHSDGENNKLLIAVETFLIFEGKFQKALTNNHFTSYWIMYTAPGQSSVAPPPQPTTDSDPYPVITSSASPPQQPSLESSTKIPSKNGIPLPFAVAQTKESNCDDDGFPLWLLILVIIIDIILAMILILLIIFARRGIKKMKTVIAKKKNPKAAGASKHGAPSPMPTTPTPNTATKDKKKTTETVDEPKAAGRTGGKTTEGKTTKFYTVDQTKYYTVDTTFDKSKDEKK